MGSNNGWAQWKIHVLSEIERLNEQLKSVLFELEAIKKEVASLSMYKKAFWLLIGGMVGQNSEKAQEIIQQLLSQ